MGTRGITTDSDGNTVTGKRNTEMTSTQRSAWQGYRALKRALRRKPTVRELMTELGLKSPRGAQRYIDVFRAHGLIPTPNKGRKT